MQFTILSHAGILIEHDGVRLVCDPWLIGSCYWRSWWNFPEPPAGLIADLRADYVYLTHLHWDHFHGPSLKKLFDPGTTILMPKAPTRRMVRDLHWLGFHNVREIPHGERFRMGSSFTLRSYQFGPAVDSAAVVTGGDCHLFNCNDAKFFGLPLRQIMRDFPRIDFILRSHSSASPIPYCVENYQTLFPPSTADYDSADQFARCALFVGARYAVPFASNHCFLHAETERFNSTATTPEDVRKHYQRLAAETHQPGECVVMPPGSRWSDTDGFSVVPFDFGNRAGYIDSLKARHGEQLAATYREEAAAMADFDTFRRYFEGLLNALPRIARQRLLPAVLFRTRDAAGTHLWLVDPKRRHVRVVQSAPSDCVIFDVHPRVLNDCASLRMFSVWSASKRLKIHLPSAANIGSAVGPASRWLTVLDLYEVDMLPLRRNFSPRSLSVRVRRWREAVEVARILLRRLLFGRRFSVAEVYTPTARISSAQRI